MTVQNLVMHSSA